MKSPDRILVVDDVPDNLLLVRSILEDEGYEVITATQGQLAITLVTEQQPDLLLLDVMMPDMDGYEVTKAIRSIPDLPFIPILLITAYDRANAVKGLDLGADEFIRKPIEAEELLARVRSLLRLKHSIAERDRTAKERQDLVSRLTHDLRTPLVAADRMLELLQGGALGELSAPVKEALAIMARSNRQLLEMVNQLLEVYRYEAGSKILNYQPLNLGVLVQEVAQELSPIAHSKALSLQVYVPQSEIMVKGDRLELKRVFNNLVGNALKFTERGSVTIRVETDAQHSYTHIIDTGIGIKESDIPLVFQRFRQGSHHKQGSGLGLYLSKHIIEAHQGKIRVHSEYGKGSIFTVTLPTVS
ncbi:MAG: sensor histidine kinase [Pseudanabaenaceae cyanobacterium]